MQVCRFVFLLCLSAGAPCLAETTPADFIGSWRLVEQTYGEGTSNLVRHLPGTLRFEIKAGPEGLSAFIRSDVGGPQDLPWPAFVNESGARPVQLRERLFDAQQLSAFYEVVISEKEEMHLRIREIYQLDETGALTGTMDVQLVRAGRDEGGFLLHRRFERES